MKKFKTENLIVEIFPSRDEMGKKAAEDISCKIKELLETKNELNIIFAAAPSQNEVLKYLSLDKTVEWNRINAYHMDEYIGLSKDAIQGFGNFLKRSIFSLVPFKSVNYINPESNPEEEAERYGKMIDNNPPDIVVMGIGENGHIAFNDPGVADFNDEKTVKAVELDDICRNQQVNDGCFQKIDDVPKYALTLTVPTLMKAQYRFCIVPAKTKAEAVKNTVKGVIGEWCPATCLRIYGGTMYLDKDSSSLI